MSITVDIKGQPVELLDTRELAIFHNKTTKVSTWILDTFFPNRPVFYSEPLFLKCAAKGTLIVRAAQSGLEENAVRLTGRADAVALMVKSFFSIKHS